MFDSTQFDVRWYDFLDEVAGAFYHALGAMRARTQETAPLHPLLAVRSGYAESPAWFLTQAAEFEPAPLTVETLRVRDVYASEMLVRALLELMASETWFERNARAEYVLTDAGRAVQQRVFARRQMWLAMLHVEADAVALAERTLRALIVASLDMVPAPWCLVHSRRRAHWQEISPLGAVFQLLEDFNALRDDAHMAAWQPFAVAGYVWEALAFLGAGQAHDAASLFAQLHYRGYTQLEYADALDVLAARGWVECDGRGAFGVTDAGRVVRTQAEILTDRYFFQAWQKLSPAVLSELYEALTRMRAALLAVTP